MNDQRRARVNCEEVTAWLVDAVTQAERGTPAAPTAPIEGHLRSCLVCFRAQGELRAAPRITAVLREADGDAGDRAAAFWDQLAARTSAAAAPLLPRPLAAPPRWRQAARPFAGALLGATAVALLMLPSRARHAEPVAALPPARAEAPATRPAAGGADDGAGTFGDGSAGGAVRVLGAPALRRLLDDLRADEPRDLHALLGAGAAAGESAELAEADPADDVAPTERGMLDELAALDDAGLQRLARSLAGGAGASP